MTNLLPSLVVFLIWGGATILTGLPFIFLEGLPASYKLLALAIAPLLFIFSFATLAGLLSHFGRKGMIAGKFPREPLHPVYLMRRIFNGCWTQLFYFKPVYSAVLAIPFLRTWVFRLFGYKDQMHFVVYPDTWLRDLPLLSIGHGAYIANRSTIGTNMCLSDGQIFVEGLEFGENAMIGHMALLAPGGIYGKNCEIGTNAICGIRVRISDGAKIHPVAAVNHGSQIGRNAKIGTSAYVGLKTTIGDNIEVPSGAVIPDGTIIRNQEQMNEFFSSETKLIRATTENVTNILKRELSVS